MTRPYTPGYEREAFEAGASGRFKSFESWHSHYFTCQDCHQDTSGSVLHECPARFATALGHPYRTQPKVLSVAICTCRLAPDPCPDCGLARRASKTEDPE